MSNLTQKQIQVLQLRAEGKLNRQISDILNISEVTIHQHLSSCCKRLSAHNTAHAIAIASQSGILNVATQGSKPNNEHALHLTTRDRQILQHVAKGDTNAQIANIFGIHIKTVETYFQRMALRNGTSGRMSLAMSAVRSGQITL